jgi:SIT family siderophore-iron:H+ symporter-like MFS transporter
MLIWQLLKDRGVWAGFCVAMTLNAGAYIARSSSYRPLILQAFNMQSAYLFPMLRVAFDQTELSATRITSLYSFSSVITGRLTP